MALRRNALTSTKHHENMLVDTLAYICNVYQKCILPPNYRSDFEKLRLVTPTTRTSSRRGDTENAEQVPKFVEDDSEQLFVEVDKLMAGSDEEKERALGLLQKRQNHVSLCIELGF